MPMFTSAPSKFFLEVERGRQPVRDLGHGVAELGDHIVKHLANEKVVLDDQDARHARRIVCLVPMPL
jgi:hypothetical protein